MSDQISALYITQLVAFSLLLLIVFHGYNKTFGKRLPLLDNLAGGFIVFLALNELLAAPFILLHWNFSSYFYLFIFLNVYFFVVGLKNLYQGILARSIIIHKSGYMFIAVIALLTAIGLSQTHSYFSGDDSFYISLIEQNQSNTRLYSSDPESGTEKWGFPKAYRFQGWELIESGLSKFSGFSSVELTKGLMPFVILTIVFVAYLRIFSEFLPKNRAYLAVTLLFVMLMMGGFSDRSEGAFIMTRPWQGKSILAALMIPYLIFSLHRIYQDLRLANRAGYLAIFIICLAALTINPSSVFLCSSAIIAFGIIYIFKFRSLTPSLKLVYPILAFLPIIILTFFVDDPRGGSRLDLQSYLDYLRNFVGNPSYHIVWLIGLIGFYRTGLMKRIRGLVYFYPLALFITILNPIFFYFISENITSTAYWRLFWLVPLTITLPIIGVLLVDFLTERIPWLKNVTPRVSHALATAIILLVFILSGRFVFNGDESVKRFDLSRTKLPPGVADIGGFMKTQPDGFILASAQVSAYLRNITSKHEVLAPRNLNLRVRYDMESDSYIFRKSLLALTTLTNDNKYTEIYTTEHFHQIIRRYGVSHIIYKPGNGYIQTYVDQYHAQELYRNSTYIIVEPDYTL